MQRNPAQAETLQRDEVRFQLSLLRLLYPTSTPPQLAELERLLNPPANLAPAS